MRAKWDRTTRWLADLAFADRGERAPAEHLPSPQALRRYMVGVLLALLPATALAVYHLGVRVLVIGAVAFAGGRLVELATAKFRAKPTRGGSLNMALLLALTLPADLPLWLALLAAAFGTFFAREIFGGTGHNVFNPVLVGKAFAVVSFPTLTVGESFDALGMEAARRLLAFRLPASETCAAAVLLAVAILFLSRAADWRIACSVFIAALAGVVTLRGLGLGELPNAYTFLFSGGFLFGAGILAVDPATAPGTKAGRCFYGLLIGLLAAIICGFTANAQFMMFAILLGNMTAPLLDAAVLAALREEDEQ